MILLVLTAVFVGSVVVGIPVAFALGVTSFVVLVIHPALRLSLIVERALSGVDSFTLLAVPLFIVAGALMDTGGISHRLVRLARALVGHVRGGLGMGVVVSEMFFSGISGSTLADVSAMSAMTLPAMRRSGYPAPYSVAIIAAASAMGILIPPCILMVVLAGIANVSVAALFIAGIVPATVLALIIMALLFYQARRYKLPSEGRASLRELGKALIGALIPLGMPVIIFGGILSGATTPTEAAGVAVLYAFAVGVFVYREVRIADLPRILADSAVISGSVLLLVALATIFSYLLAVEHVPESTAKVMVSVSFAPWVFLILANLIFVLGGAVLEGLPAALIFVPILLPVVDKLGINVLHFLTLVVASVGIGLFLPPIGAGLVTGCTIGKVSMQEVFKPMVTFLVVLSVGMVVLTLVPWFTTVLPEVLLR